MTHAPFQDAQQSDYRLLHSEKVRGKVILAIRTDKPEAELYLYKADVKGPSFHADNASIPAGKNMKGRTFHIEKLVEVKWQAHRELSSTIHKQLVELLILQGLTLQRVGGIVCYKGPGSFTGLRIGLSVANALAYANQIPIIARKSENWLDQGIKDLLAGKNDKIATPFYERPAYTTKPRK